jgi:hypothetical protein
MAMVLQTRFVEIDWSTGADSRAAGAYRAGRYDKNARSDRQGQY